MTYNVGLILVVVFGAGVGHFIFHYLVPAPYPMDEEDHMVAAYGATTCH